MASSGNREVADEAEPEKPKPRCKTVMRLMAQGERAEKKLQAAKKVSEEDEPICKLISMEIALRLKELTSALARELPQDVCEMRMARLRAPKSSTQTVLRDGATVDQAATHAALKALEQWVRILRPFASSENLAMLVAGIVHVKDDGSWKGREVQPLEVVPPAHEPLGAALRRIVPDPEILRNRRWEWIEDLLSALSYEEMFDRGSFVHRSSTPSGMRQTGQSLMGEQARPRTTGTIHNTIPTRRPTSEAARMRLSGDFAWAGFQGNDGFRTCTSTGTTDKYVRSIPGPTLYCDYDKKLSIPQNPGRGSFPSFGDRRTACTTLPLFHLDRFFAQNYKVQA